jgi:electron transfer flavoprotein alpha subunit
MSEQQTILLLAEQRGDELAKSSRELVTAARGVAQGYGAQVAALLVGPQAANNARELAGLGVDKVYVVNDQTFSTYDPEPYLELLAQVCADVRPKVVLMAHSDQGRDLAPRLAFRLGTAFAPNCVDMSCNPASAVLHVTRPVFGGKAHGHFTLIGAEPHVVTLGQKVFEPATGDPAGGGEILAYAPVIDRTAFKTSVVERVIDDSGGIRLEDATVIVAGGRGIGSAGEFATLKELASMLGGCVGASRAAVDSGWAPSDLQVGLTGSIVSPKVYLAIGISGAAQHMAGCSSAETIIAINKDPEAPIFQRAAYGAVADWRQIVPPLVESCRAMLG